MPKSISFLLLGMAFACGGGAKTPEPVCMAPGHIDDGSCTTVILNMLASPESYEGKTVSVLGFVEVVPGGDGEAIFLYPSRDARAQLELIRRRHRVGAPPHATGVFTRPASSSGLLGEIRVRSE